MCCKNKITLLFIFILVNTFSFTQDTIDDYNKGKTQQEEYSKQPIKPNTIDKKNWNELKKKIKIKDYQPKKKKDDKKKDDKKKNSFEISEQWRLIIKWLIFGILIGLLVFLVLKVLGINPFNRKTDKNKIDITLEELEENLDTAAIDPHLYEAIKSKNFKLAIRLYYLMIIQKLALKEKIIWKKHKTNKHYLNEIRNKEEYEPLKKLTLTYEKSWFGEDEITEEQYNYLNKDFVNFLQNIK